MLSPPGSTWDNTQIVFRSSWTLRSVTSFLGREARFVSSLRYRVLPERFKSGYNTPLRVWNMWTSVRTTQVLETQQRSIMRAIISIGNSYLIAPALLLLQEAALTAVHIQGSHILWFHRLFWGCVVKTYCLEWEQPKLTLAKQTWYANKGLSLTSVTVW